jgi:hypothetical protein
MKNSLHSWVRTLKVTWDLGARGLSDCVEGSWRDWNHARLASAGWRRPWISASNRKKLLQGYFLYLFWSALPSLLHFPFICFLSLSFLGLFFATLIRIIAPILIAEGLLQYQSEISLRELPYETQTHFVTSLQAGRFCFLRATRTEVKTHAVYCENPMKCINTLW